MPSRLTTSYRLLAAERRRLAAWLQEWRLDQALPVHPDAGPPAAVIRTVPPPPQDASDGAPAQTGAPACSPGDIRLIYPPCNRDDCLPPLYVAVLRAVAQNVWLVAPFGRFSTPAVPSEWRTGLKALPLRVLCLWNARTVADRKLAGRSCRAGALSARLVTRIPATPPQWAPAMPLQPTPAPLSPCRPAPSRVGPPLLHPADPRWIYLERETDRMDAGLAAGHASHGAIAPLPGAPYPLGGGSLLKAAEDSPDFG